MLEQAPATGTPDPYTSVQITWVLARWHPPALPPRTGEVLATAGARKGSTVRTWIDASGSITDPPPNHRDIDGNVTVAVVATCFVSWLVLLAAGTLARQALDRCRLNAWEADWRASGPLWSGHRLGTAEAPRHDAAASTTHTGPRGRPNRVISRKRSRGCAGPPAGWRHGHIISHPPATGISVPVR